MTAGSSPGRDDTRSRSVSSEQNDSTATDDEVAGSTADESSPDTSRLTDGRGEAADPHVGAGLLDEEMGPSSAMAHLYRGEVHRMKLWRERLDQTTNWAVIVIAALLTWAFASPNNPHYIVLVGVATLSVFLVLEARRYRGYDTWRTRVRTIQENVWAYGLDPDGGLADEDWRERLGNDYREPALKITAEEAIAHRLRRVYLPLFTVLLVAWLIRITAFASGPWLANARIGIVPGAVVVAAVGLFYVVAVVVACRPRTWHAKGELRSEDLRRDR